MSDVTGRLRTIADAATPGPWRWGGNLDTHTMYLSTVDRGRQFVMQFRRWGMRSAQPEFQDDGHMVEASALAVRERDYRGDIERIDHPDAEHIATFDPRLVAAMLDVIAEHELAVANDPIHDHGALARFREVAGE